MVSKWISVKNRLPDVDDVIGYALSEYTNQWYVSMLRYAPDLAGTPFWDDADKSQPREVSHWKYLPEPPK